MQTPTAPTDFTTAALAAAGQSPADGRVLAAVRSAADATGVSF